MANTKGYKRSWKNYLLDSNYQLRFTFTMLAIAAGLMAPLGWWVSQKSATATEVAVNKIDEIDCPELLTNTGTSATKGISATPSAGPSSASEEETDLLQEPVPEVVAEPVDDPPATGDETADDEAAGDEAAGDEAAGDEAAGDEAAGDLPEGEGEADSERERPRSKVTIDPVVVIGEMKDVPATPEQIANSKVAREACQANVAARKSSVRERKALITNVMIGSAVLLLVILTIYGIKTTHRVAGPLHKVGLYLGKLENNVYDTVYNLRKGDQLIEFYDHFKGAHQGLTKLQEEDRDRLRDAIALAKEAGLAEKNPELAELIPELERLLAEKEESFVKEQA